jgi:hypothetical protein
MIPDNAVLCYVDLPWAFFTTAPLAEQWGDDWNDAPYEHNAGRPYEWREGDSKPRWDVYRVAFDADYSVPSDGYTNSPYSVQAINGGAAAWLWGRYSARTPIPAGTPYPKFRQMILDSGGTVFEPVTALERPEATCASGGGG